jgi:hypothetical protein
MEALMLILVKILLTLLTLAYSAIPTNYDLSDTHATNPSWTPHARWHVVWQVASYDLIALLSLFLIWTAGDDVTQLWIPTALTVCCLGGFWIAFLTQKIYGGAPQDKVNGVPKYQFTVFGREVATDANLTQFTPVTVLLVITVLLVARLNGLS